MLPHSAGDWRTDDWAAYAALTYEGVAVLSGLPTITRLSRRYPALGGLIVGGLVYHLLRGNHDQV